MPYDFADFWTTVKLFLHRSSGSYWHSHTNNIHRESHKYLAHFFLNSSETFKNSVPLTFHISPSILSQCIFPCFLHLYFEHALSNHFLGLFLSKYFHILLKFIIISVYSQINIASDNEDTYSLNSWMFFIAQLAKGPLLCRIQRSKFYKLGMKKNANISNDISFFHI